MRRIEFSNFNIKKGRIELSSRTFEDGKQNKEDKLWFEFSKKFIPS